MIDSSELPPDFDHGRLVALVGQIYDTVTDPSALTPVLDSLAKVIRGSAAQVYTYDNESGQIVDSSVSSALRDVDNDAYVRYYGAVDPRLRHVYAMPVGTGNRCHAWFDDRFVSGNEFYQDFFIPAGFRWVVGSKFDAGNGTSGVLAGLRAVATPACETWTVAVMNEVAPHFRRAAQLRATLERSGLGRVNFEVMVNRMPAPAALFGSAGELLLQNERCKQLWRTLPLKIIHSTLRMNSSRDQTDWSAARRSAVMNRTPGSFQMRDRNGVSWRFEVVPCSLDGSTDKADAGLMLVFAERVEMSLLERAAVFGLPFEFTDAEVQVLALLMSGMSLSQVAAHRGVGYGTVRTQLDSAFDKTGLRSQPQLIAAAMRT